MLAIVSHTPLWVFAVFALLLVLGLQALRPRSIAPLRAFATPAVFIAWGLGSLMSAARSAPTAPLFWAVAAAAGGALALASLRLRGLRAESDGRVYLPGSPLPLLRNMAIFAAKYALAATLAIHPAARGQILLWDIAVSGASAGYFIGWSIRFVSAWRQAQSALVPAARGGGRLC